MVLQAGTSRKVSGGLLVTLYCKSLPYCLPLIRVPLYQERLLLKKSNIAHSLRKTLGDIGEAATARTMCLGILAVGQSQSSKVRSLLEASINIK